MRNLHPGMVASSAGVISSRPSQRGRLRRGVGGGVLRLVVRAVPREHNNEKESQKDFGKVVDRCLADMVI